MSAVVPASSYSSGAVPGSGSSGHSSHHRAVPSLDGQQQQPPSRYESQKRRDWNTFGQYLRNHRPPLELARCSGAHVLEFLRYLDQFGKTKVHAVVCPFFGRPHPPAPCPCPLRQAWGSLDALIGRLRAAFEENGGGPEANPFAARAVRLYLREVRDTQAKARGIAYEKKKRKRPPPPPPPQPSSPPPPMLLPQGVLSGGAMMEAAAGLGNFQVGDLNLASEALLMHHHQQQYYLHHAHHGYVLMAPPNGSGGNGGGGMVVTVPDSHNGSQLIPLSLACTQLSPSFSGASHGKQYHDMVAFSHLD